MLFATTPRERRTLALLLLCALLALGAAHLLTAWKGAPSVAFTPEGR